MEEELQLYLEDANERMKDAIDHLQNELLKIRAGKASPAMLDGVMVDYYGTTSPLNRVANVNTQDARTIVIQPWDKTMIQPIEKAIMNSNLGFNPDNNGEVIRINVPILTEDRRRGLVKQVKAEGETSKISIRNVRKETNEEIKKLQKNGLSEDMAKSSEETVQGYTNKYTKLVEDCISDKEAEIMTV